MSTESNSPTGLDKKSVRSACVSCHNRKIGCDASRRGFPCSNCITHNRTNCRKHEKKKRGTLRYSGHFVPLRPHPDSTTSLPSLASGSNATQEPSTEPPHPRHGISERSKPQVVDAIEHDAARQSILRGVRLLYIGRDVSNMNFLVRQQEVDGSEEAHHFSNEELFRQSIVYETDKLPREAFILPPKSLADELVEAYFTYVNPGCPLVDEELFMEQYRSNPAQPLSLLVLQAIFLVGAHVSCDRSDRDSLKTTFFRRAKMLFDARLEKNRDFIIQAALLLTWHSDGIDDTDANAWFWVGIATRTCYGLGLHRDRANSKFKFVDDRTWTRIFWILFCFDVMVSLYYGRPQAINLDECDNPFLSAADFEGCGPNVQIDYIIKKTELCILISKALRERFGLRVSERDREIALTNADDALANWCLDLPPSLQLNSANMSLWTASLHMAYHNFLILLHRPHPRTETNRGANDADICGSSANTIATVFENLRSKDQIKYLWISDINALITAMVQVSVELRFSNPVLAINALRRFDSSLISLRKLAEYWLNAESILRIFEESSQVQHGNRLGRGAQTETSKNEPTNIIPTSEQPQFVEEKSDLRVLAEAADALRAPEDQMSQGLQDQAYGWGTPMAPIDPMSVDFMIPPDLMGLDDEWRKIYWEEPGISGEFADGFWGL